MFEVQSSKNAGPESEPESEPEAWESEPEMDSFESQVFTVYRYGKTFISIGKKYNSGQQIERILLILQHSPSSLERSTIHIHNTPRYSM